MKDSEPTVRNVSDTARWAAYFRAQETKRPDALFRDPLAERLAGPRGLEIGKKLKTTPWAWIARTVVFDQVIARCVQGGVDTVVNLAAGLDARPYRLPVPASLHWIEVDLPGIVAEKEEVLSSEKPLCRLERVALDLADVAARRALFARIGASSRKALVICEGLLIYFSTEQVAELARDLAVPLALQLWVMDLVSPGLLRMIQKESPELREANAPLRFGPPEGPPFFEPHGWTPAEVHGLLKTAAQHRRVNVFFRMLAKLPESTGRQGNRPWGGVCLLKRR